MKATPWMNVALGAWLAFAGTARSQSERPHGASTASAAPKPETTPPEIVVTASGMNLQAKEILEAATLSRESQSRTVEGFLGAMAGIDLNRQSYSGSESQRLSIRGFDETRSLILLDGRSLHGAGVYGGYYVDWASLSLEGIEAVEVIRGAAPPKYGNTLGGVVNILSREAGDKSKTTIRAGGGSMGTWEAQAGQSAPAGPLTYSVSAGRFETDGHLRNASVERNVLCANLEFLLPAKVRLNTGIRYTENEVGMIVYNMPDAWRYEPGEPNSLDAPLGGSCVPFRQPGGVGLHGPVR